MSNVEFTNREAAGVYREIGGIGGVVNTQHEGRTDPRPTEKEVERRESRDTRSFLTPEAEKPPIGSKTLYEDDRFWTVDDPNQGIITIRKKSP